MRIIRRLNPRNFGIRDRLFVGAIALFVLSTPAITPRLHAADEIEYFAYLRSVWFDGDLSFDNEYRYFYDRGIAREWGFEKTFLGQTTATGLRPNYAPVGTALLWAPFYAIADLATRAAATAGATVAADGYSRPYVVAITYASAIYGFLAVVISVVVIRTVLGGGRVAALAVCAGTPLIFYMYVAPGFSHACSAFAVAAFVLVWLRVRRQWTTRGVMALGAMAALMGMVREQDVFLAIGPAVDYGATMVRARRGGRDGVRPLIGKALAGIIAFSICYAPQAAAYVILNGRLAPDPLIEQKMFWSSPHALRVLFSPNHGVVFWTPLFVVAVVGLILLAAGRTTGNRSEMAPDAKWIGLLMLVMVASQIYVSGSVNTWSAAGSFGQRRLIGLTVFLSVGVAMVLRSRPTGATSPALPLLVVACIWWNLGLIAQFGSGTMNRQRLELSRNTYNNFVVIPRSLPGLTYRYLFDRSSFYKSARTGIGP
jgi:hypothetical protein